ncbi:MAG: hypothetical protein KIT84_15855 [Labilithrix sp.]|nr:hypothetical protein [Labilithrix sp.]MCW5812502.1 hypothetical protein [Labilithrix sp.]
MGLVDHANGALERYRTTLRTAPPAAIEEAHADAIAQLTHAQRRRLLAELANAAPPGERAVARATSADDAQALGRLATRAEMRQPGFMERALRGAGGLDDPLLGSFAMAFLGSTVASGFSSAFFDEYAGIEEGDFAADDFDLDL